LNNWQLYPGVLRELARTSRVSSGRACLLTHDHKCMLKVVSSLQLNAQWFEQKIYRQLKYSVHRACKKDRECGTL